MEAHPKSPENSPDKEISSVSDNFEESSQTLPTDPPKESKKGDFKVSNFRFYVVCSMLISEAIASTMLFSYVGLFVAHIEPRLTRSSAGYVAGLLVGTFQAVQVFSLPLWGRLSDKIGRKPVLLLASLLSVLACVAFGFSTSFLMAMLMRGLHGAVAGGVGTAKTFIFEVTDEHSQARGFGLMNLMWAVGSFIGPSVGGFLYDINNSPIFSQYLPHSDLFDKYPALPPALALGFYALISVGIAAIFVPESNQRAVPIAVAIKEFKTWLMSLCGYIHASRVALNQENGEEDGESSNINPVVSSSELAREEGQIEMDPEGCGNQIVEVRNDECTEKADGEAVSSTSLSSLDQDKAVDEANAALNGMPSITIRQIFSHPLLRLTIPMYMLLCGFNIAYNEVFPLYAIAYKEDGGLGFTSTQIGISGMINAAVSIGANSIFSHVTSRISMMKLWTMCLGAAAIAMFSIGFFSFLPNASICLVAFVPLCLVRTTSTTWAFSLNMMFTANAAPKRHLGLVTTVAMACASVARSITPILAGPIFAWSLSNGNSHWFPFNHFLLFLMCGVAALLCILLGNKVPEDTISLRRS